MIRPTRMVYEARDVAMAAHGGQRYGSHPYVVHLDDVHHVLAEFHVDDEATHIAAYLHDTLEDTKLTSDKIEQLFGDIVSETVAFCTDEDGPSRRIRKRDTYARIRAFIDLTPQPRIIRGVLVKVADRLANIRACYRESNPELLEMYRKEKDTFRAALQLAVPHAQLDPMWAEYDHLLELPNDDQRASSKPEPVAATARRVRGTAV